MNCKNCGAELKEGVSFCAKCGAKAEFQEPAPVYAPPRPEQQVYTPPPEQQYYAPQAQQQYYAPPPPAPKPAAPINTKLIIIASAAAAAAVIIVVGGLMGWGPIKFGEAGTAAPDAGAEDVDEDFDSEDFFFEPDDEFSDMDGEGYPDIDEFGFNSNDDDIYEYYDEMYWPWKKDFVPTWPEYADSIQWYSIEKRKKSDVGGHGIGSGITVNDDVKGYLNVRAIPSTKADVVGKLMPGEGASVAEDVYQTDDRLFFGTYYVYNDGYTWIYIHMWDDDSVRGWVATDYVSEFGI